MELIEGLISLVYSIWHADTKVRDGDALGGSEFDRRMRRSVGLWCGGTIAVLICIGLLLWYFSD